MAEVDPVTLRLFVDNGQAIAGLNRYERVSGQAFGAVQRGSLLAERAIGSLTGVLAGVSAIALARSFLEIADSAKSLDAQLRLATAGFGSFGQAQADVRRIAADTRSGLEETASLYGNFSRGARELGATQAEAARATETFSKTLKISGADAGQAASATLQFGQALASGALRGDELNSILEASPRLARLLTDSLGVPIGKIKELGEAGALTSDKLLAALTNRKFTEGIDNEFRELPVTFDDAMTQVSNAAIITFGAFDRGGQFSTALANFITDGTNGFEDLEQAALDAGVDVRSSFEGLADVFEPLVTAARAAFADIGSEGVTLASTIRDVLSTIDRATNATFSETGGTNFLDTFNRRQQRSETLLRNQLGEQMLQDMQRGYDAMGNPTNPQTPRTAPGPSKAEQSAAAAAARRAGTAAAKAERERLANIRDEGASARELIDIDGDILAARAALARASEDILQYELDQLDNRQASRQKQLETERALGDLTQQEFVQRSALLDEETRLRKEAVRMRAAEDARRAALDIAQASMSDDQDILRAQSGLAETRQERRAIELRLLDIAYDQERADLDGILASTDATAAQKQIAQQRLRILDQLKGYDAERIEQGTESPLDRRRREARQTAANMGDAVEDIELEALDRLTDGLADASVEFLKLGGVAGDVLNSIINDFVRLAAQQAIFGSAGSGGGLLGSIGGLLGIGGGGPATLLGGTPYGGARATGGPVSAGKTYLVGEQGPELFRADSAGTIVPNSELVGAAARGMVGASVASSMNQQTGTIRVVITHDNDMFTARVQEASVPVAIEVVRQSAPGIAATAKAETIRDLGRQRM